MLPLVLTHPGWDPVALRFGPVQIHWYALMYLVGFAIGYVLLRVRLTQQPFARVTEPAPWTKDDIEEILLSAVAGVIIGGRLGYCLFYNPTHYATHPLEIAYVWQGGMSFHGGAIGVALALAWYAWRRKCPFLQITDLLVPAVPTGLAAGRLGNFINGELWGRETSPSLPWAMIFPHAGDLPRHPSQLYEFALEGVVLFVLLWVYARKERAQGQVSGAFVFGYGLFRFIVEYFREPDSQLGLLGPFSMGQWLCVPMILGGAVLWWWARRADIHVPEVTAQSETVTEPKEAAEPEKAAEPDDAADALDTKIEKTADGLEAAAEPADEKD